MVKIITFTFLFLFGFNSYSAVVAKIGNKTITDSEFKKSYLDTLKRTRNFDKTPSKKEHLEDLIRFELSQQEAQRTNLKNNPFVKQALKMELHKGLLEVNLNKSIKKIKVTEQDMKNYYAKYPYIRSAHILVGFPFGANKTQIQEARKRALKIQKDVSSGGKTWETYVRMYSDDEKTKPFSGEMGYRNETKLNKSYYMTLKKIKLGEVSQPVQGPYGFHIIKKIDQPSYSVLKNNKNVDAKYQLMNALKFEVFHKKRLLIQDRYFESLKKRYKVTSLK